MVSCPTPKKVVGGGAKKTSSVFKGSVKFQDREWQISFISSDNTDKLAATYVGKDSDGVSRHSRKECLD